MVLSVLTNTAVSQYEENSAIQHSTKTRSYVLDLSHADGRTDGDTAKRIGKFLQFSIETLKVFLEGKNVNT